MPNPVIHFEIQSSDSAKSIEFFTNVFGWHIETIPQIGYSIVDTHTEGKGINGGIGDSPDGQSYASFYIEVDDIQGYLDKVVEAGGKVLVPVTVIPDAVTMAVFEEPTGAVVGLVQSEEGTQH